MDVDVDVGVLCHVGFLVLLCRSVAVLNCPVPAEIGLVKRPQGRFFLFGKGLVAPALLRRLWLV